MVDKSNIKFTKRIGQGGIRRNINKKSTSTSSSSSKKKSTSSSRNLPEGSFVDRQGTIRDKSTGAKLTQSEISSGAGLKASKPSVSRPSQIVTPERMSIKRAEVFTPEKAESIIKARQSKKPDVFTPQEAQKIIKAREQRKPDIFTPTQAEKIIQRRKSTENIFTPQKAEEIIQRRKAPKITRADRLKDIGKSVLDLKQKGTEAEARIIKKTISTLDKAQREQKVAFGLLGSEVTSASIFRSVKEDFKQEAASLRSGKKEGQTIRNTGREFLARTFDVRSGIARTFEEKPVTSTLSVVGGSKGVSQASKGFKAVRGLKAVEGSRILRVGAGFSQGVTESVGLIKGTEQLGILSVDNAKTRKFLRSKEAKVAEQKARAAEKEALRSGFGLSIPFTEAKINTATIAAGISPAFSSKKDVFKESLKSQGLNQKEQDALFKQRGFSTFGEATAQLNIARFSEGFGRRGVTRAFEEAGRKGVKVAKQDSFGALFKLTAPRIAEAGVIEGGAQEIITGVARKEKIKPSQVAIGAGVGGVTAGLIGGTIAATKLTRPVTSKTIEFGTNIIDPFEKPGDILQDVFEGAAKRSGRIVKAPVISAGVTETSLISFGTTPSSIPNIVGAPVGTKAPTQVKTPTTQAVQSNLQNIIGFKQPITDPVIVTDPITDPVPTPSNTNNPIFVPTDTNVNVPINIPAAVPITIPVSTPILRAPPPLPLGFSFPRGSGFGSLRPKGKTFFDELSTGRAVLSGLGIGVPNTIKQKKPQKRKKTIKRRAKRKRK